MDPEAVSRPTMTRDDALKVLVKTKFVCCIYLFIISVLALIQIQCSTLDEVFLWNASIDTNTSWSVPGADLAEEDQLHDDGAADPGLDELPM